MRSFFTILPLVIALGIGVFLAMGLNTERRPNIVPSAIEGKQVPEFELDGIGGMDTRGLSDKDLSQIDGLKVVNFFASWCVPCRAEHAIISEISARESLPLIGINYKNRPQDAKKFLDELGNPYTQIGSDFTGRVSIGWGLVAVPETLIIGSTGIVLHHHRGPLVGQTAVDSFLEGLGKARITDKAAK